MWPWGHLAVGYLAYSGFRRLWTNRPPTGSETLSLALGSQFPDVVDKTLAWGLNVLPTGRSLTHSLLTASILLAVTYRYCQRNGIRNLWTAFAVGYLTHPFADVLQPAVAGDYERVTFLLWPLLELPAKQSVNLSVSVSGFFVFELFLVVVAVVVWVLDGTPGLDSVRPFCSIFHREQH
ncbi:metal-dependent hydrolase [Haladaptatus cibarius]|uniref:metal-dependent hydrolase n=1 Tax=Haladaptatus cibarius TaxID=453847 RepID=UPI0006788272|nr:metal-dependent hydrolase [Haladaptatus cibarius]